MINVNKNLCVLQQAYENDIAASNNSKSQINKYTINPSIVLMDALSY